MKRTAWPCFLSHNSGYLRSEASHTFQLLPAPTHFLTMLCCPISSCELRERITAFTTLVRDLVIVMKAEAGRTIRMCLLLPLSSLLPWQLSLPQGSPPLYSRFLSILQPFAGAEKVSDSTVLSQPLLSDSKPGQNYQTVAPLTVLEQRLVSLFGKGSHQKYL